jgi:hypothetical protein
MSAAEQRFVLCRSLANMPRAPPYLRDEAGVELCQMLEGLETARRCFAAAQDPQAS